MPLSAAEKTHKLVLKLFTKFYLPFHVLDSQEERAFVRSLNDNYVTMNRKYFSNAFLISIYNEVKEKVKQELTLAEYVSITTVGHQWPGSVTCPS